MHKNMFDIQLPSILKGMGGGTISNNLPIILDSLLYSSETDSS